MPWVVEGKVEGRFLLLQNPPWFPHSAHSIFIFQLKIVDREGDGPSPASSGALGGRRFRNSHHQAQRDGDKPHVIA